MAKNFRRVHPPPGINSTQRNGKMPKPLNLLLIAILANTGAGLPLQG